MSREFELETLDEERLRIVGEQRDAARAKLAESETLVAHARARDAVVVHLVKRLEEERDAACSELRASAGNFVELSRINVELIAQNGKLLGRVAELEVELRTARDRLHEHRCKPARECFCGVGSDAG